MEIQIFGTQKSPDTKKALRYFAERGVKIHFVDLKDRPMSAGELKRFLDRFGVDALVDRHSKRYAELGLAAASPSPERWKERLAAEPLLLRQPLARFGTQLTLGLDEAAWRSWCDR